MRIGSARPLVCGALLAACLAAAAVSAARAADFDQAAQPGATLPDQAPSTGDETSAQPQGTVTAAGPAALFAEGITVEEMAELLRDAGYRPQIEVGSDGMPYVTARTSGLVFWINFYSCEGEPQRCWDIEFHTNLETTPEQRSKAAQWAIDKVLGRPYSVDDNTYFAHPVRIGGGVTRENMIANIELWDTMLGSFIKYIDW